MLYLIFSIWNKLVLYLKNYLVWRSPKTIPPVQNILFVYLFIFPQKAYGAMRNCHYISSELCGCSGSDYVSPPAVCMTRRPKGKKSESRNSTFFKQWLLFTQWPPAKQSCTVSVYADRLLLHAESSITLDMLADQTDDMLGS